jgi:hypothetical protein
LRGHFHVVCFAVAAEDRRSKPQTPGQPKNIWHHEGYTLESWKNSIQRRSRDLNTEILNTEILNFDNQHNSIAAVFSAAILPLTAI